jgi:dihydrofolate synthase/folylpolyglutamate synthase
MDATTEFLEKFNRFGIDLTLDRIKILLDSLGNPQNQVPIIHVAGSNGKGSVCAYLHSILNAAGYRVGCYTSPHLVSWTERICINHQPITSHKLHDLLQRVTAAITPDHPHPTQFEIVTAAMWLYFAEEKVDIAVIEVGLGGRLDATNVCDRPLVTAITSISREHWQNLGPTLAAIAGEKAGILKANCPAVIGPLPAEAELVVQNKITELNCPAVWVQPATLITSDDPNREMPVVKYQDITYSLPLNGNIQLTNSAIALECMKILQKQNWDISLEAMQQGMANTTWPGRMQWLTWKDRKILIDGAHNSAAAKVLRQYIDSLEVQSVTWVVGILSTKDHPEIFQALLKPADHLHLVPVPSHSSMSPEKLAEIAITQCPELSYWESHADLFTALDQVLYRDSPQPIVVCGSLYLIGYLLSRVSI